MILRYRDLGRTGLRVSEVGFGAWGIGSGKGGGLSYGPKDDRDSIKALERSFEKGINFFDTSDLYGNGHSEKLIGDVFESRRNDVIIATKVGYVDSHNQDFRPESVERALAKSLKRLKTDYIDVYQLHNPSLECLKEAHDLFELLNQYRLSGVIRAIGVSARSPDEAHVIADKYPLDCVQVNMNLTDMRAMTSGLLERCGKKKIGVVVRSPLALGFLSGELSSTTRFHNKDHRNRFSAEQMDRWRDAVYLYRGVVNDIPDATNAQNALRFCLSHPTVSTVIPGIHTQREAEENSHAGVMPLFNVHQMERIAEIYRKHPFFIPDS